MNSIKENKAKINEIEYPIPPYNYLYNKNLTNSEKVEKIQNYIDKLQYNHTGFVNKKKCLFYTNKNKN